MLLTSPNNIQTHTRDER